MDLFDQVSEDIKTAMKAKDKVALETLRNIKKFFLEAKTAPGANDILTDDAALKIIQKLVKQGKDSAEIYIGIRPGSRYGEIPAETNDRRRTGSCIEGNYH